MIAGLYQPMHLLLIGGYCFIFVAAVAVVVALLLTFQRRSAARASEGGDLAAKLARLEDLKGRGLVTEDEYQTKRRHLLDQV